MGTGIAVVSAPRDVDVLAETIITPWNTLSQGWRLPCPWYRGGMCTSPSLDTPSTDVTLLSRCLSSVEYATCRFYKDADQLKVQHETASREYGKPILLIHALNKPIRSECRFYRLLGHESGSHLAVCDILKRYLNVYEVNLCANYWNECPFRRLGESL